MAINEPNINKNPSSMLKAVLDGLKPWGRLVIGIVIILLFIFGIGRLSGYIPGARRMADVIDDHDLKATAIFYTDFEISAEGSEYIRNSLHYSPHKMKSEMQ